MCRSSSMSTSNTTQCVICSTPGASGCHSCSRCEATVHRQCTVFDGPDEPSTALYCARCAGSAISEGSLLLESVQAQWDLRIQSWALDKPMLSGAYRALFERCAASASPQRLRPINDGGQTMFSATPSSSSSNINGYSGAEMTAALHAQTLWARSKELEQRSNTFSTTFRIKVSGPQGSKVGGGMPCDCGVNRQPLVPEGMKHIRLLSHTLSVRIASECLLELEP